MNGLLRSFRQLLGSCVLTLGFGFLLTSGAAAQTLRCDTRPMPPMTLRSFQQAADAFANLPAASASQRLRCLQDSNPELAEVLMLFQSRLRVGDRRVAEVEAAFLHYVINKNSSIDAGLANAGGADLGRLVRTYRQSLLLTAEPDANSRQLCDADPPTLERLRCHGQAANRERYGRDDVVPVRLLEFDPAARSYSRLNAAWMSEMSALAYWDARLVERQLGGWGYTRRALISDPASETSAFLAAKDDFLVLSFRGTSGFKNFVTDVDIRRDRVAWAEGTVHRGFRRAMDAVWPQVLEKLGPPGAKSVWVTGHSLGAALAQLTALRLVKAGYRVHSVYTFGTPRIGDQAFVSDYDRHLGVQSFPHVNARDVVTRVPPQVLGFRAAAGANTQQFTGPGHVMKLQTTPVADNADGSADWRGDVSDSINETTRFLPAALRPAKLRVASPPPPKVTYSTTFESGPLGDHGSFEYLFKLVCASIDFDLWPKEGLPATAQPSERQRK